MIDYSQTQKTDLTEAAEHLRCHTSWPGRFKLNMRVLLPERMKAVGIIAFLAFCLFAGAAFSTFLTVGAWHIQIEPRAFQCWDSIGLFDTYWESIDEHREAGDKISAGWKWDKIKTTREIYIGVFFVIWAASSLIPFGFILRREAANKALHATAAQPGS